MCANPLFSVIIPVYNVEKYIEECVNSILNQSYLNYEIILVDDGSPDGCPQICDRLEAQNNCIKVIHKDNGGVSSARMQGAMVANGEYILCVDGDDWLSENCLSEIAEILEKMNVDMVCHGLSCCDSEGNNIELLYSQKQGYYRREDIEREIFPTLVHGSDATYFIPSLCGKAIRKELFLENAISNKRAVLGEDGACVIPCVFHSQSIYIINKGLYCYRFNSDSVTKSRKVFCWEWIKIVNNHIIDNIEIDFGDFREQMNRKITHDIFVTAVTQFYKKDAYRDIVRDVKNHLLDVQFKQAITNGNFGKSFKGNLMRFALKKRALFLLYIYSRLKK